jgi:hypothetical protein
VGCGELDINRKGEQRTAEPRPFVKAKAQTPKPQKLAGFPADGFVRVAKDRRCAQLESFVDVYHREFLQGLELPEITGKCIVSAQDNMDSYQLDFTLIRSPEQLSFRTNILVGSSGKPTFEFHKLRGENLEDWEPRSEEFILHVNMSHLEITLARWVGVE